MDTHQREPGAEREIRARRVVDRRGDDYLGRRSVELHRYCDSRRAVYAVSRDAYTNTDAYADTYSYAYANTNCDPNPDADGYSHADANSDADSNTHGNADTNAGSADNRVQFG